MTKLTCDNCNKSFTSKHSLDYHMTKNVCTKTTKKFKCQYCNNSFSFESSLSRHINHTCKERDIIEDLEDNSIDSEKNELLKKFAEMQRGHMEMIDRINKLEKENSELRKSPISKSIQNNINKGTIYNGDVMNITVNVVPFGKEDMSKIDRNDLLKAFRSGFNSTLQLAETTHFNPKYPEFHNVYISSMKNKYAMTYDGNNWALVMKDDIIDQIYDKKRDYIEENMDEFLESLSKSQIDALHRWLEADDKHDYVQKVKNNIKLMLYNKRQMITDPSLIELIELKEPEEKVIKVPKGNIIDPPYRTNRSNKVVIKEIRENAGRPGTKRKMAKAKRNN